MTGERDWDADLRDLCAEALAEDVNPEALHFRLRRAHLDVEVDGEAGVVTLVDRAGHFEWSSTAGSSSDIRSAHVQAALMVVAGGNMASQRDPGPGGLVPEVTFHGAPGKAEGASGYDRTLDGHTLDRFASQVVTLGKQLERFGVAQGLEVPAAEAAFDGLRTVLGPGEPPGLLRWLARLRFALEARDAPLVHWLLFPAVAAAEGVLESSSAGTLSSDALVVWLGGQYLPDGERVIQNRRLVEVGRELAWAEGISGLERRILCDTDSGELLVETVPLMQGVTDRLGSVGPCPRSVQVGLGMVDRIGVNRRVRIRQYAVEVDYPCDVGRFAQDDWEVVRRDHDERAKGWSGLTEYYVLLRPTGVDAERLCLVDAKDRGLAMSSSGHTGASACLVKRARDWGEHPPRWVLGRLEQGDQSLVFFPVALDDGVGFLRLVS